MIAHYRKSRDKFSRAVAREATELLGEILKLLWGNSEADSSEKWKFRKIFQFKMHLNMAEHLCGDYFPAEESSLSGRNSLQII